MRSLPSAGAMGAVSAVTARDSPYAIEVLRWQDERRVALLLARAFVDDPLVIAICGAPPAERLERMRWSFRIALRGHCLARQPAWTIAARDGAPLGVALVTRPRPPRQTSLDLAFTLRGFLHVGLRNVRRGFRAAQVVAAHAPHPPFTYLRTLGIDPDCQGQGLGSRLVECVVRAAPGSLPLYLETAKERNLAFYARHGFERCGEFQCLGVRLWRLTRPPASRLAGPERFG